MLGRTELHERGQIFQQALSVACDNASPNDKMITEPVKLLKRSPVQQIESAVSSTLSIWSREPY